MNETLAKRASAASAAMWWTVLIGAIWVTAAWLIWLTVLHNQRRWLLVLWGGEEFVNWHDAYAIMIKAIAFMKMVLFGMVLAAFFLGVWARRLRKAD